MLTQVGCYKYLSRITILVAASKDGSILTAWGPLAIHQRVRANHGLMGLGRFKKITKNFLFLFMKTNNCCTHGREILIINILSVNYIFFRIVTMCVPSDTGER